MGVDSNAVSPVSHARCFFWILTNMIDMCNGSWLAILYGYITLARRECSRDVSAEPTLFTSFMTAPDNE